MSRGTGSDHHEADGRDREASRQERDPAPKWISTEMNSGRVHALSRLMSHWTCPFARVDPLSRSLSSRMKQSYWYISSDRIFGRNCQRSLINLLRTVLLRLENWLNFSHILAKMRSPLIVRGPDEA